MKEDFTSDLHDDHLELRLRPDYEINKETTKRFWDAVIEAYQKHECKRVLVEGVVKRRVLGTMDAYESGLRPAEAKLYGVRVALCFHGYKPDELSRFFTNVAANRGVQVRFFEDAEEARRWLGVGPAGTSTRGDA